MMLLGLIAVGVLAIASTQNRLASYASIQMEARQQALIGLDAAIAEMQFELGPDQRVTANSSILSEGKDTPGHVLGVWNSWKHPLYSHEDDGISSTYQGRARQSMFRRWLISSRDPQELTDIQSVNNLCKSMSGRRICLVGEGTLGKAANTDDYIFADLIEMPSAGKNTAAYAWWVCGENQKAHATLSDPEPTQDAVELLHRTWDTPAPSFRDHPTLSFLDSLTAEQRKKILTIKELEHTYDYEGSIPGFYDVTPHAQSLPVNVRDGGFKYDLNLLLNKESLISTPFAGRSEQDCPIAEDKEIPTGTETNMPIGSWQVMHCWYNTWPDASNKKTDSSYNSRLMGSVQNAWTTMSGELIEETTPKGDRVTYFSPRARGTASAGYARAPILTTFLGCFGLAAYPSRYGKGNTLGYLYSPMVTWWNPYNVRMRIGGKKLWMYSQPYRTSSIQVWTNRAQAMDRDRPWGPKMILHPADNLGIPWQCCFHLDWGNYFVNSLEDETGDIIFEPGEFLVFTMGKTIESLNEVENVGYPQESPFILGDHPDQMHHHQQDFEEYVNMTNPNASSMYDMYIDHFNARLKFESKNTPSFSGSIVYGIATDLSQAEWFVSMGEVLMSGSRYEEATHTHTFGREAFSIMHGYDGLSVETGMEYSQLRGLAQVDRFPGAKGISPAAFTLGWYDYEEDTNNGMLFLESKWSLDMFYSRKATYYVAVGIVPKSYNESLNDVFPLFKGKDYRTKTWQHSSPAFWGSALYRPDDQQRQYHPYQLTAIELGAGANRGPLDTVNGKNGVLGLFGAGVGGGENASFISVLELPYHPPFSLAAFAGMRLTPGWYSEGQSGTAQAKSIARMRHVQYQAGVPGVGIGNSFADPCLPADGVYAFHETKSNRSAVLQNSLFSDFYDHALLINDALWDSWFCSSVSDMPQRESGRIPARETLTKFMKGEAPLPVSRYKSNLSGQSSDQVINRILADDGWQHIARYLLIEGGFNINSTSVDAWTATLQGLAKRDLLTNSGEKLRKIEKDDTSVLFSRFMVSTANRPIDSIGYSPLEGSSSIRSSLKMATAWGEVRSLSSDDIRELARRIVQIVRERGPFLNMSDFINRRLDGGSDASLTGALQAAIDATDINAMFTDEAYNVNVQKQGDFFKYPKAAEGSMYTAAPGYLIQSDVLSSLGNILTVRDDTFTVRAYGCVRNARNAVLAQAWCEATVQRTVDYVDPIANKPEDADRKDELGRKINNSQPLSEINRVMGRKLKIISFRWIDSWDI